MKTKLAILSFMTLALTSFGQLTNYDYSTVRVISGVTIIGDTTQEAFQKTWGNFNFLESQITTLQTNPPVFTATNIPNGSNAYVALIGVTSGIAYYQLGIPGGAPGTNTITNTVTAYAFSNQFLSSAELLTYSTNNITWSTSNYLARVTGLYRWVLNGGQLGGGGMSPGTNVFIQLTGSYSGTNAWFIITNGFRTTNVISLAATGAGGGLGNASLFAVDHPELLSRTNTFFGQYLRFNSPSDPADAATKSYVDTAVLNVKDGNFTSYTSNGVFHFIYSRNNSTVFDMGSSYNYITISNLFLDATGTNLALQILQGNLSNGYTIQSSTNLALTAGFIDFTNYAVATNSGVVTFTIPLNFSEPQRFFRATYGSASSATFYPPLTLAGGSLYPSNTWSLATISNQMSNFSFWQGSSNGQALVTLWKSNAAGYYVAWSNGVPVKTPAW